VAARFDARAEEVHASAQDVRRIVAPESAPHGRKVMMLTKRLGAGLAGSVALTLINELGHRVASESPRLDVLGMRAIVRGVRATGREPPRGRAVPLAALAGDLVLNALNYGLAAGNRPARPVVAGFLAGVAAALIGPRLGMNDRTGYHWGRRLMMVGFYTGAGVAAAAAAHRLARR
jgi:hypothetical protein